MNLLSVSDKKTRKMYLAGMYFATLILHLSISVWVRGIYFSGDGFIVASTAAFFAGENWSTLVHHNIGYFGYGQAVLYIPIFLLTKNPELRYILMGVVNSALLACIPLLAYGVLLHIRELSNRRRFVYAALTGVFPSYLIYTKWIWNETLLAVLPWVLLYLIIRLFNGRGNVRDQSILLAIASVYCYAVSGRGLAYIVITVLMVLAIVCTHGRKAIDIRGFLIALFCGCILQNGIKSFFLENLYLLHEGDEVKNTLASFFGTWGGGQTQDRLFCGRVRGAAQNAFRTFGERDSLYLRVVDRRAGVFN